MKLETVQGRIVGYKCEYCNSYNDILTVHCWNCNTHSNIPSEYRVTIIIRRMGLAMTRRSKEEQEQHFITLYNNATRKAVEKSTFEEIDKWIEELEELASEARITLRAAHDVRRERAAKLSKEEREKLLTKEEDNTGSDKILKPRAKPKTAADKLVADMAGLGLTPEQIAAAMTHVKPKAREIPDKDIPQLQDKRPVVVTFEKRGVNTHASLLKEYLGNTDWSGSHTYLQERLNTVELMLTKAQKEAEAKGEIFEIPESLITLRAKLVELNEPKAQQEQVQEKKFFNPFGK